MSNLNRHPVRRTAAGVLAGALALSGAVAAATPVNAATGFSLERIAGNDRYETSAAIADRFRTTAGTTPISGAILASGEAGRFPDALSANFLAGVRNVPVLLTRRDSTPAVILAALGRLGGKNLTIVGGTDAVSAAQQAALTAAGYTVTRIGGADRYDTSQQVIAAGRTTNATATIGILATGQEFADALAAGPLAYKGKHPIFLTRPGALPAQTMAAITASGIKQLIVLGGDAAVSPAVRTQLTGMGVTIVQRFAGVDRSDTSVQLANYLMANGFTMRTFNVASGDSRLGGVDALGGGALSGLQNRALLITNTSTEGSRVVAFAASKAATLNEVGNIFGGPAAVSLALEAAIEAAGSANVGPVAFTSTTVAQGANLTGTITGDFSSVTFTGCGFTTPQAVGADDNTTAAGRQFTIAVPVTQAVGNCDVTFTFTPTGGGAVTTQVVRVAVTAQASTQTLTVAPTTSETRTVVNEAAGAANDTSDDRTYTATGLTAGTTYRITLVDAASVQTSSTGVVTFRSSADTGSSTGFSVDIGSDVADIISVNNASPTFAAGDTESRTTTVQPVNGSITFTIDGDAPGTVVPVLYVNGGAGGTSTTGGTSIRLETSATAATVAAGTFSAPVETFGVGGPTVYVAPLAANGSVTGGSVASVDKATDSFVTVLNGVSSRFTFDANDLFEVGGVSVGLAAFEAQLSSGDAITGTFTRDVAGVSTFSLTDDNPATPTGVAVTSVATGAQVAFTTSGDVDSVNIYRALSANGTDCATLTPASYSLVGTDTASPFVDTTVVRPEQYCYTVSAVNDGDESARATAVFIGLSAADTTAPTVLDARVGTNQGSAFLLELGDTIVLAFSEAVAAPTTGDTFRLQDADGTVVDVVSGTATRNTADVTINGTTFGAGRVLTITRSAGDVTVVAGTQANLGIPATITAQAGATDAAGNEVSVTGSADVIVDTEAGTVTP